MSEPYTVSRRRETAFIVHPDFKNQKKTHHNQKDMIAETEGLARAIDLDVIRTEPANVTQIQAGYFFSKGIRDDLALEIQACEPDVVIVNHSLSPVQQRNLEKLWKAKVLDRTGLILEIFGARAQTKEGQLQVELAALEYQRSRLVRSWTHLERQRGGAGFMGGPGETQIEIDRRLISERITRLKKQLEDVRRTRGLAHKSRERVPLPVVALVGYTNAGKSTLFNTLTKAGVFAEDLPFATLDPTIRRITLPGGEDAVLSDTVGFISDLPTTLIAAFRATLEQIAQADVIAHVVDSSKKGYEKQRRDVIAVLRDLGIEYEQDQRIIEVYNKSDLWDAEQAQDLQRKIRFSDHAVALSALNNEGLEAFLDLCESIITRHRQTVDVAIRVEDGKAVAWLHQHGHVLMEDLQDNVMLVRAELDTKDIEKFHHYFGYEIKAGQKQPT